MDRYGKCDALDFHYNSNTVLHAHSKAAQHLHATFCTHEWLMHHINMKINQVVVMRVVKPRTH
jgi:hypothetical protein